jgi:hypothetical protein
MIFFEESSVKRPHIGIPSLSTIEHSYRAQAPFFRLFGGDLPTGQTYICGRSKISSMQLAQPVPDVGGAKI